MNAGSQTARGALEPQWCPIRGHYCRCEARCDDYDRLEARSKTPLIQVARAFPARAAAASYRSLRSLVSRSSYRSSSGFSTGGLPLGRLA